MAGLVYSAIFYPIIYILSAYAANGTPVIFGRGAPLDFNARVFGRRLFGPHKTIRGTLSGLIAGIAVGLIEYAFLHYMLAIAVVLTLGALLGDLIGSFAKRQLGIKSGSSVPILDQYGFFVVAMLLAYPLGHQPTLYGMILLVVLTGLLHVLTNIGAHRLRLKKVPW